MSANVLSVVIIEDHALVRENLKMGLEVKLGYNVLGAFVNPLEAKAFLEQCDHLPDVILMDVGLPEMDGIEATYRFKKLWPHQKVVMITSYNDAKTIQASFKVKAEGYCTKETSLDELKQALDTVMDGHRWLDPRVADVLLNQPLNPVPVVHEPEANTQSAKEEQTSKAFPSKSSFSSGLRASRQAGMEFAIDNVLSSRELDILRLIADNSTNEEIASKLKLSEAWISGYIQNIITKLTVNNEMEAVQLAMESGFVEDAALLNQQY